MNRTIKEATVQRYHYDDGEQLRRHLDQFVSAYNFGRRLKTLKGLTPYEAICRTWQSELDRNRPDPNRSLFRRGCVVWFIGSGVDRRR